MYNTEFDEEYELKKTKLLAISIGKYFDGKTAKEDYDSMLSREKMKKEVEDGNVIYEGEEKLRLAKEGEKVSRPKPIKLKPKLNKVMTKFELENNLGVKGDIIS